MGRLAEGTTEEQVVALLKLIGIDQEDIDDAVGKRGAGPQNIWDSFVEKRGLPKGRKEAFKAAEDYFENPRFSDDLRTVIAKGRGLSDKEVSTILASAGPYRTDSVEALDRIVASTETTDPRRKPAPVTKPALGPPNPKTGKVATTPLMPKPAPTAKPKATPSLLEQAGTDPKKLAALGLGPDMDLLPAKKPPSKEIPYYLRAEPEKALPGLPDETTEEAAGDATPTIPALRDDAPEHEVRDHIKKYYGYMSWMLDIPELATIARDIAETPGGNWTPESVQGAISSTQWWAQNGKKPSEWLRRKAEDPVGTNEERVAKFEGFKAAVQAGGIEIPDERLWAMADEALKWGWSESTIQAVLGSEYRFDASKPTATTTALRGLAHDYYIPMGDQSLGIWTKQILAGEKTEDDFKMYLRETAKSMFPHMAAALDRGETVEQYAAVYKEHAANVLELNPQTIDFSQAKWLRTLTKVDPKTGERGAMSLAEFDKLIRTDSSYGYEYTKNAMNEASSLFTVLSKKMGVAT